MQKMEPEQLFSFTWHPYAVNPDFDYSKETPTLGRIQTGKNHERHAPFALGVRVRQDSHRPPCGSIP